MRPFLRWLIVVGICLAGVLALTIARQIASERGVGFGALPSIIIAVPFLFLASRFLVPRSKEEDHLSNSQNLERLESIAANPEVTEKMRAEARRRAGKLRADMQEQ
ncbi:MAG TPA: hypothetical protein VKC17_01945 [Sphingomicrobium sp.]|nr:hypothetical protein [Sphingomicrobium sp.]